MFQDLAKEHDIWFTPNLGGINRARIKLYEEAAAYRFRRNDATPTDAAKAWELF